MANKIDDIDVAKVDVSALSVAGNPALIRAVQRVTEDAGDDVNPSAAFSSFI